jgi:transcriptional regulator with XRE-family HTH domain
MPPSEIVVRIQKRRRDLGISVSDLARRSGVSRATVIRILDGSDHEFSFANLQAILLALGISLDLTEIPAELFIDQVATTKAKRLIALTQGNVALESQAVPQTSAQCHLDETKARIAASSRKLWAS